MKEMNLVLLNVHVKLREKLCLRGIRYGVQREVSVLVSDAYASGQLHKEVMISNCGGNLQKR